MVWKDVDAMWFLPSALNVKVEQLLNEMEEKEYILTPPAIPPWSFCLNRGYGRMVGKKSRK